jgi:hypothetical protein
MNILFKLRERDLLVSEEPIPLPGSFALPIELVRNLPTVPVEIGQVQVPMLIDTGDDAYAWEVRTQDLKSATLAHPPLPVGPVINGARSQQTLISTLATTVNLGPVVIDRAVVGINDDLPVPDFGVDFLSEFNIEFEPKRMIASFQPLSPTSGTKIKGSLSPGFTLRFDDAGTVSDVVPDSPADQYGMRPGDKILAVDGRPIQAYKPRNWDEALVKGKHLKVRWLRGTNRRLDSFEVMELH